MMLDAVGRKSAASSCSYSYSCSCWILSIKGKNRKEISVKIRPIVSYFGRRRAPVAQLDRVLASGAKGCGFDPAGRTCSE